MEIDRLAVADGYVAIPRSIARQIFSAEKEVKYRTAAAAVSTHLAVNAIAYGDTRSMQIGCSVKLRAYCLVGLLFNPIKIDSASLLSKNSLPGNLERIGSWLGLLLLNVRINNDAIF